MAKNHTVDEEMADVRQQQHLLDVVDACRPDSGLSQTDLPISDPTEINASKEAAPACNNQLYVETSNAEYTAAGDQATHNGDMVPEGLDHLEEATTPLDANLKFVEDVAGAGADGKMVDSDGLQNENFHPQAGADGFSTDAACYEMMTVDSSSQTAGVSALKLDSSVQTIGDGSTASDTSAPTVVNASPQITVHVKDGPMGDSAVVASVSLNAYSGSAEGMIGDSSNQVAAPSSVGSGENIISDSSDHVGTGEDLQ